jgi:hypothetical protein
MIDNEEAAEAAMYEHMAELAHSTLPQLIEAPIG